MRCSFVALVAFALAAGVASKPHDVHVTLQKRYTADGRDLTHAHAARNAHFSHRRHHARAVARRNESEDCEDETETRSAKVSTQASDDEEDCEDENDTSKTRQASTTTDDDDCEDEPASTDDDDCEEDNGSSTSKSSSTKAKAQVKVKAQAKQSSGSSSKSTATSKPTESKSSDNGSGSKSSDSSSGKSSAATSSFPGGSSGTVTFYTQDGTVGACGLFDNKVQPDSALLAALCPSLFQSMCGKTFKITDKTTGKSVDVLANDECPSCACDHVDLSLGAFDGLGQSRDLGVLNVNFG